MTTDFTNTGYEVTVKKPDGTTVEIHIHKSYNVWIGLEVPPRGDPH